jgi:uncharacterized RDD family membrane protein YckC
VIDARRHGGVEGPTTPVTYELATWGVRGWAYLIDLLVLLGLSVLAAAAAMIAESDTDDARRLAETLGLAIVLPLWLAYAPLMLMRRGERNGQTLGKQAMRIRVVRENGAEVSLGNGLLREVIGRQLLFAFTYGLYGLIDYGWPLWDRPRQCLHDKVGQTRVVLATPVTGRAGNFTTGVDAHAAPAAAAAPTAAPATESFQPPTSGRSTVPPPSPPDDTPVRGDWLPPTPGR